MFGLLFIAAFYSSAIKKLFNPYESITRAEYIVQAMKPEIVKSVSGYNDADKYISVRTICHRLYKLLMLSSYFGKSINLDKIITNM